MPDISFVEYLFWIIFGVINMYILYNDLKFKIISNKALCILGFLGICGFFIPGILSLSLFSILWIFFNIFLSFGLFYFNIWSAGDAKYVIILSLFIPGGALIYTLGNIGVLTLFYLLLHTVYIYLIKPIFNLKHGKELGINISKDLYEKIHTIFIKSEENGFKVATIIKKMSHILIGFLVVFTCIRLSRIYIINTYIEYNSNANEGGRWEYLLELIEMYNIYFALGIIAIIYVSYKLFKKYITLLFAYISKKLGFSNNKSDLLFSLFLGFLLSIFIVYEYFKDPELITESIILIFTLYIFLWLLISLFRYIYYITFQLGEVVYKPITELSAGDAIDKQFLIKIFGTQKSLGYGDNKEGKYFPNPGKYFEQLQNPIDQYTCNEIRQIYQIVNSYHKNQATTGYKSVEAIKTHRFFSFAPYVFGGFIISLIYQDTIIRNIVDLFFNTLLK